jgi:NAD(P)-dependent dehydrogenase (short-subunit alcohol dehydrogenase family)
MGDLLSGKVAIITGSGRGIGRGMALKFAEEGASVVVNDLGGAVDGSGESTSPADEVVGEIVAAGGSAVANYDSVTSMEGGENIVQTAIDNYGRLDIVVTPAGILRDRMIFNMTEAEWDDVIAVHLKGTFTVVKHACIVFRQQRSGCVITFSSTSGLYGNSGQANYGAAKDGIAGFTRGVARDMGRYGVRVNGISPGASSRMTATVPQSAREIRSQSGIQSSSSAGPLQLTHEPEDIAPFVTWLASDEADGVNGHIFHVTGGEVSLMNNPEPARTMHKPTRWTVDEIAAVFPQTLGLDLVNPAPTQAPRN